MCKWFPTETLMPRPKKRFIFAFVKPRQDWYLSKTTPKRLISIEEAPNCWTLIPGSSPLPTWWHLHLLLPQAQTEEAVIVGQTQPFAKRKANVGPCLYFTRALLVRPLWVTIYRGACLPRSTWPLAEALAAFSLSSKRKHSFEESKEVLQRLMPFPRQDNSPSSGATTGHLLLPPYGLRTISALRADPVDVWLLAAQQGPHSRLSINTKEITLCLIGTPEPKQQGKKANPEIIIQRWTHYPYSWSYDKWGKIWRAFEPQKDFHEIQEVPSAILILGTT